MAEKTAGRAAKGDAGRTRDWGRNTAMGPRRGFHRAASKGGKRVQVLRCASKRFRHRVGHRWHEEVSR